MAIYLSAGVSGAHLNPAVSIALWLFAGFEGRKLPFYITAQVAGAFCAAALVYTLYSSLFIEFEQAQNIVRGSQDSLAPGLGVLHLSAPGAVGRPGVPRRSGDHRHPHGGDHGLPTTATACRAVRWRRC